MKIYLNLLPEDRKKELNRNKKLRLIIKREFLFFLPVLVFTIILLNIYFILGIQKTSKLVSGSQEQSQGQYQELKTFEEKFKQINDKTILLSKIQKEHIYWSWLIQKLSELTSVEIFFNEISTKDYQVFLLGRAKTRDNLISFKDALINSGCAENVNMPLSNLVTKENVDFQIDFMVKSECIKEKK